MTAVGWLGLGRVGLPCALALAAPFTLGTAQRLLARLQVFLRNALVLERMAQVDTIVFDRNGYKYHGRVKALADAAREGGLQF